MESKLLKALVAVSEQLAKWSLNDGCLDFKNITNDEQEEKERLELVLEEAIVGAGGKW